MTSTEQILSGLQNIVNEYSFFAIIWHILFYILFAALIFKWKPSNITLSVLLCLPLISVSALAWIIGNPFNGSLFVFAATLLFIFGMKAPVRSIETSRPVFFLSGIIMVIFGIVYPHFIQPASVLGYLYSSPAGLIPCPTLSILIGLALLFDGFGSRSLSLLLIIFGLFYGLFGVLKLKVLIDLFLLFGTLMLLVKYVSVTSGFQKKFHSNNYESL
ncbi:MAG: hypothetical protein ACM3RX_03815 [Methanococcaceae archaeon]